MNDKNKSLIGYDEHGRLVDEGSVVHRFISKSYLKKALEIYDIYKTNNLSNIGIVETQWIEKDQYFSHEKHTISYPYEWPTEMYKDAVLFHLNLLLELDSLGLALKDAQLSNVLFDSTRPVFVDFLSIIKTANINDEKWLVEGFSFDEKRFAVIEKMLIPFVLIPLLSMANRNYAEARKMLSERACNMGNGQPELSEAFYWKKHSVREYLKHPFLVAHDYIQNHQRKKEISDVVYSFQSEKNLKNYVKNLYELVNKLEVTPPVGGYSDYYKQKQESFNFSSQDSWGAKQKSVFNVLKKEAPASVLDIGANTGWFSFLAEYLGASVIALEIEEDCINALYNQAKKGKNRILPLLISYSDLSKSYYGSIPSGEEYSERDFKNNPLFLSPIARLHVELVMCLGLIHHLVLGMGNGIGDVFKLLSQMAEKSLLLEFVSLDDPLVIEEPSFFRNIHNFNKQNYNLDQVILEGKKYFATAEILASHPESRTLILFKKA